jgi:hypothetical protein
VPTDPQTSRAPRLALVLGPFRPSHRFFAGPRGKKTWESAHMRSPWGKKTQESRARWEKSPTNGQKDSGK